MPEIRGRFGEFDPHLRPPFRYWPDVDDTAGLLFGVRGTLNLQNLLLRNLGRQHDQGAMGINDHRLGLLAKRTIGRIAGNRNRQAQHDTLATAAISVLIGARG